MKFKQFGSKYIIKIEKGEELVTTLKKFCTEQNIKLGSVYGIGAANKVTIRLFDPDKKEYFSKELNENFEIAPVIGNISTMKGETYLHLHINLGDKNFNAFAGHLNEAVISATCELIIEKIDGVVDRYFDEEVGLNLFDM